MTNKYKKAMQDLNISDNVEKKILAKCEKKRFNYPLVSICTVLILCISLTIVNADNIRGKIRSLGTHKIVDKNGEFETSEIHTIKTKVDDKILDTSYNAESKILRYSAKSIQEVEDIHGIDLIDFQNNLFKYDYFDLTEDGHITTVLVSTQYDVYCGKNNKCDVLNDNDDKVIDINATIYTSNYTDKEFDNDIYNWAESEDSYTSKEINNFAGLNIKGYMAQGIPVIYDGKTEFYYTSISFAYDGISYYINASNMTYEEIESYLKDKIEP